MENAQKISATDFTHVVVGDVVTRRFVGKDMKMKVTAVDDKLITAGLGWQFERKTGWEYDPDCRSGSEYGITISYLIKES